MPSVDQNLKSRQMLMSDVINLLPVYHPKYLIPILSDMIDIYVSDYVFDMYVMLTTSPCLSYIYKYFSHVTGKSEKLYRNHRLLVH